MLGIAPCCTMPPCRSGAACPFGAIPFVVGDTRQKSESQGDAMTYLVQIYTAPTAADYEALSPDEQKAITDEYVALMQTPGVLGGHGLQGPETATTVRVR